MRNRKTILLLALMLLAARAVPCARRNVVASRTAPRSTGVKSARPSPTCCTSGVRSRRPSWSFILRRLRRRQNFPNRSRQFRTASSRIRLDSEKRCLQPLRPCGVSSVRRLRPDSTVRNDIHVRRQGEQKEKAVEKPPPSVMAVKWIAVGLIALFLLLLILKFKILRF